MSDLSDKRRQLAGMLMADRQAARREGNASAAVTASSRIAALALDEIRETGKTEPYPKVETIIIHVNQCPCCKTREVLDGPPASSVQMVEQARQERARDWDDDDEAALEQVAPVEREVRTPDPDLGEESLETVREANKPSTIVKGIC
jgi:hypothetical protein